MKNDVLVAVGVAVAGVALVAGFSALDEAMRWTAVYLLAFAAMPVAGYAAGLYGLRRTALLGLAFACIGAAVLHFERPAPAAPERAAAAASKVG